MTRSPGSHHEVKSWSSSNKAGFEPETAFPGRGAYFFFEEDEIQVNRKTSSVANANEKAESVSVTSEKKPIRHEDNFSFMARQPRAVESPPEMISPFAEEDLQLKRESRSAKGSEKLEEGSDFFDDQYFEVKSSANSQHTSRSFSEPQPDQSPESLATVDEQYFANLEHLNSDKNLRIEVKEGQDYKSARKLVQESTQDLNYLDQQLFRQPGTTESDNVVVTPPPKRSPKDQVKIEVKGPKVHDEKRSKKNKKPRKDEDQETTQYHPHQKSSALAYVEKLRSERKNVVTSKEDLVDAIDVGVQSRILGAMGGSTVDPSALIGKAEAKKSWEAPLEVTLSTQVKDKYKPTRLTDFTHLEVGNMLKELIVYNDSKACG